MKVNLQIEAKSHRIGVCALAGFGIEMKGHLRDPQFIDLPWFKDVVQNAARPREVESCVSSMEGLNCVVEVKFADGSGISGCWEPSIEIGGEHIYVLTRLEAIFAYYAGNDAYSGQPKFDKVKLALSEAEVRRFVKEELKIAELSAFNTVH